MDLFFIDIILPIVHVSNNRADIVPELSQGIDRLLPGLGPGGIPILGLFLLRLFLRHFDHRLMCGRRDSNVKVVVVENEAI